MAAGPCNAVRFWAIPLVILTGLVIAVTATASHPRGQGCRGDCGGRAWRKQLPRHRKPVEDMSTLLDDPDAYHREARSVLAHEALARLVEQQGLSEEAAEDLQAQLQSNLSAL